jgi:precorrin-6Y C5,15-methyltransferase (decarboxylating)
MANKLYLIGIGPGNPDYIYPAAQKIIESSDVLIGGRRNLDLFSHLPKETFVISGKLEGISRYIIENIGVKKMVVLVSGDPGLFSIAAYLKDELGGIEIELFPGISSLQYLCAKLTKSWDDIFIVSLHGREREDLAAVIEQHDKVAIFTGGGSSPDSICRELAEKGLKDVDVIVGEDLSYPGERIVKGSPEEIGKMEFKSLSMMLVENRFATLTPCPVWDFTTTGIPDELFIRGDVPMTKAEVRAITLSKLRLKENSILYDIGAGTGSVAIECGLQMKKGRVYAIEKEPDAQVLIRENALKFGVNNLTVVPGEAPGVLSSLPLPDRIFIGGTGGRMKEILDWFGQISHHFRMVVNAVTLESAAEALARFKDRSFREIDLICVSVTRGRPAGEKHMLQALNPVYIISAESAGEELTLSFPIFGEREGKGLVK